MKLLGGLVALTAWAFAAGAASADPCTAPLPSHSGDRFAGTVRYVGDGDSLCVGASSNPAR